MNKRDQSDALPSDYELYFLITKFLEAGPCTQAVEVLKQEISQYEILPKRYDWEGNQHDQTFDELEQKFRHIGPKHLVEICQRIGPLLDKEIPPSTTGLTSLLGCGKQSIMRTHKDAQRTWRSLVECSVRRHQMPLLDSVHRRNNHIINVLHGRECSGSFSRKQAFPTKMYSKMQLLSRTLGHLSAVYCCLFDGTGRYVLTGADDMLIKVWSAIDGRLLATLRGVLSELTDIAVNLENTLLAAGSVDKIIRVWCLQTAFPVAVLIAHTGMITGVNFCPGVVNGVHYLASTSTDGSVAFWSFTVGPNNAVTFHPKALQYNERMRPGQAQMICASFSPGGMFMAAGSADHHVRVYKMLGESDQEGPHRILETESHSDRVDSIQWAHSGLRFISGSKDGTAIIWRFTRQRWKTLILHMATKLPGKPEVAVDPKLKLKVTMVCWSTNDKWAITACNDQTIKIWDSDTAKLFEVLRGHKEEVFVLESHPHDPNVLLSAGHDGLILLWDLQTGTQLASFQNSVETNGHGAVFDAKWSPDGTMMAATDSHGHILLFGLGFVNDKIKKLPKELFFHTDYRPLVRDASHNVLDEQTQVAPHLMPPPFLVDIDGNPYPPYLQRLVPGRESCRTEQLVPNIIMSPGGQQEVIEGLDEPRSHIDQMIQALVNRSGSEQQLNGNGTSAMSPHSNRMSTSPRSARGMRSRGDVEGVRQSIGNWQRDEFTWTRRQLITPLDKGSLQTAQDKVKFFGRLEMEEYKWEMQRTMEFKPTPMTSNEFVRRPRKKQTHAYRTRGSRVEQLQSQFENPDGFSGSVSGDSISSHNDSTARSEDLDSSSSTESSSSEYSDWIADHGLEPPKRNKRQCNKRNVPKPNNAQKKQNVEVPEVYRPSEWLSEVIPKKFPYYPQMGDEVMFFKEGYNLYLDAVRKRHVYELQPSQITPWGKIHIKEPELVKLIGIKYELRPPRLCCLRLAVMKQNGKLTGDRFSIKYHDVPDVIDFLVLRQTYETAIARNWDVGDRFRSMIDDGWWWGKILSRRADSRSEFLSYFTRWDNREEENMSPWDMEPVDPDREPAEEGGSLPVLAEEINAILYHPRPDEWPGGNRDVACDRILRGLDDIMGLSVAEPFIAPVDINQYPSYAFIVEFPIDLSTIKARFENRFYRRVTAAQFDVRYLATNAEKFNEDHSPIVRHARIVTDLCLKVIKELSDIDVPVLYRHLLESYKSETSDEDVHIDIDEPGPSTSRSTARSLRATTRRTTRHLPQKSSQPFDWRRACKEMLETLWAARDSEPFREPVDRLEHPDYDKIVSTPMDLWTVREELRGDNYANPSEFWKDIKLIFTNSKIYSPDTRSRIYAMTTRLSVLAEKLMDSVLERYRSSVRRQKRVTKQTKKRRTNRPRKNRPVYVNGTISDSDDDDDENDSNDDEDDRDYYTNINSSGGMSRRPAASKRRKRTYNNPIRIRPNNNNNNISNANNNNSSSSSDDSDDDRPLVASAKSSVGGTKNRSRKVLLTQDNLYHDVLSRQPVIVLSRTKSHKHIMSTQPAVVLSRVGVRTRVVKKEVNYTMSSTGSEDDKPSSSPVKHTVNGVSKRKLNSRLGSPRKKFNYDSDQEINDNRVGRRGRKPAAMNSNERFEQTNDHTYHSRTKQSQSDVRNRSSSGIGRGRKRRKPATDSESNHSQKASTSSFGNRPKRSVKRKNYAAMVASESESLGDDDEEEDEDSRQKRISDKGKLPMKNDYKNISKRSPKKLYKDNKNSNNRSSISNSNNYSTRRAFLNSNNDGNKQDKSKNVGMRTRPNKKYINYEELCNISSSETDGYEVLPKKFNKNVGGMRTRPVKQINYGEDRSESESSNEDRDDDDEDDEDDDDKNDVIEVKHENEEDDDDDDDDDEVDERDKIDYKKSIMLSKRSVITHGGRGRRRLQMADTSTNGFRKSSGSRVMRKHKQVLYNEDDENEVTDDDDVVVRNQNKNYNDDGDGDDDEDDDEDDDDDDLDEENEGEEDGDNFSDEDFVINAKKPVSRKRNGVRTAGRHFVRGRKRRKRSTSGSENDRRFKHTVRNAGNSPRRSKRSHRPLRDDENSDDVSSESGNVQYRPSISSRGRLRKLSPRVRAFLRD